MAKKKRSKKIKKKANKGEQKQSRPNCDITTSKSHRRRPSKRGRHTRSCDSVPQSKMGRRNRRNKGKHWENNAETPPVQATPPVNPNILQHYNLTISQQRMNKEGFHPSVTQKTPNQLVKSFKLLLAEENKRPDRLTFLDGGNFRGIRYSQGQRQITMSPLLARQYWPKAGLTKPLESDKNSDKNEPCGLLELLRTTEIGSRIMEHVLADGYKTAQKLALASTEMWHTVVNLADIWDFHEAKFRFKGRNGIFSAMTPEYTVGDLFEPLSVFRNHGVTDDEWIVAHGEAEGEVYDGIKALHNHCGKMAPFWGVTRGQEDNAAVIALNHQKIFSVDCIQAVRSLKTIEGIDQNSQLSRKYWPEVAVLPAAFAMKQLRTLILQIYRQRAAIKVLHFQKTPYLDRRLLAIILRGCPNVVMIGVYDCPFIHFGDVICLLDLIHEINEERRRNNQSPIRAFDFYPNYNKGIPYQQNERAYTAGVLWDCCNLELYQRGLYMILLKAFMKAKALGIELLFDKDHAFFDYLLRLPNPPLGIPTFLSALYRYTDVDPKANNARNERKKAIYDLLMPVRASLENLEKDTHQWYQFTMGEHLVFCSSCGYETFQEFFPSEPRIASTRYRRCAGCILQRRLDEETAHLRREKAVIIDQLCPDWNAKDFNIDAPVLREGQRLINLRTRVDVRPSPPGLVINADGLVQQPAYEEPLVRDQKLCGDSLQNLPTLENICVTENAIKAWMHAGGKAKGIDVYCKTLDLLARQYVDETEEVPAFRFTRDDGGCPDSIDELQKRREANPVLGQSAKLSYTFGSALESHELTTFLGSAPADQLDHTQRADFW